jgi:hypothetical protein
MSTSCKKKSFLKALEDVDKYRRGVFPGKQAPHHGRTTFCLDHGFLCEHNLATNVVKKPHIEGASINV